MPRVKPPRTVEQGLLAKPTVLNNVETYANVPMIILKVQTGIQEYRNRKKSRNKSLCPDRNCKEYRSDRGSDGNYVAGRLSLISVAELNGDAKFKAVQIGGPSGGCLTSQLDDSLDFDSLTKMVR